MMLKSQNTALVTGGSGGLGSAVVRMLTKAGVKTIALDINQESLDALAEESGVETMFLDVSNAEEVKASLGDRRIDILILAHGALGVTGTLYDVPAASAQRLVNVNILGIQNCFSAIVPGMKGRNYGHIIIVGSIAGIYASLGQPMYSATKAAVHNMAANLRMELYGTDIRVSEYRPGRIATGMHAEMFDGDLQKAKELFYDPYECLTGDDVAESFRYILSAPAHVNVSHMEVLPTHQVNGGGRYFRRDEKV